MKKQFEILGSVFFLAAALGFACPVSAQPPAGGAVPGAAPEAVRSVLAQSDQEATLPADTRVEKDLAYGQNPLQKLDVYQPANAKNLPVIVMVHGGAWYMGNKVNGGVVGNKAAYFLNHGYVFVSVNYRLWPKASVLEQADDVAKALAFVQSKASTWGADESRVVLMGHSAGAQLVSLLSAAPELAHKAGAKPWLGTISLDSAVFDVPALLKQPHMGFYDRVFGPKVEFQKTCSPTFRLAAKPCPMLLVYSTLRDDAGPQNTAFAARAKSFGGRIEVLPLAMEHAPINRDLGLPGKYTEAVEAFLQSLTKH